VTLLPRATRTAGPEGTEAPPDDGAAAGGAEARIIAVASWLTLSPDEDELVCALDGTELRWKRETSPPVV
jgi:type VI protein secretion system component VasK